MISEENIEVIMDAPLDRFKDAAFLKSNVLMGDPESPLGGGAREVFEVRLALERSGNLLEQRRLLQKANYLLRAYTVLTAIIAMATVVTLWVSWK